MFCLLRFILTLKTKITFQRLYLPRGECRTVPRRTHPGRIYQRSKLAGHPAGTFRKKTTSHSKQRMNRLILERAQ